MSAHLRDLHVFARHLTTHDRPVVSDDEASTLTRADAVAGEQSDPCEGRWEIGLSALVLTGLVVAMTLVIMLGAQSNREITQLKQAEQTKFLATDFLLNLRRAESSQRGYLLTGDPEYLRGYNAVIDTLPESLSRLEAATTAEPAQKARLDKIRTHFEIKRREMADTLAKENAGRRSAAMVVVNSDIGVTEVRIISSEVRSVIAFEDHAGSSLKSSYVSIYYISICVLLLLIISGFVTFYRIFGFIRSNRTHRITLRESNAKLASLLNSRTAEIARVNDEIQRYAYIVGHDLRGPLVNITGFTAELERAEVALARQFQALKTTHPTAIDPDCLLAVEQDIPEAIRFIKTSTTRMDRLIAAVLKLSREGRRTVLAEPIEMNALINDLVDCQAQQIETSDTIVSIGALPDIYSDRLALELIFGNLIENAVKYLDPARPGRIEIVGAVRGDRNVYEISDNGRGISTADTERVFELFRRAGEPTVPGEGLGLAFVRNAIYRLDGTVSLESGNGTGTKFTIGLPTRLEISDQPGALAA